MKRLALLTFALFVACVPDTSRAPIRVEVHAQGVARTTETIGDYVVTLLDARVVVGPLYFCSAAHASDELCRTARLELLEPFVVDLLDPSAQLGGVAEGTTGRVSSAQFDLGRSFLKTRSAPAPTSDALDGHSAIFVFEVEGPERTFTVDVEIDLDPARAGASLVMGARTTADVTHATESVTLRFDPWALVASIDFALLEARAELVDPLALGPGDQAYESIAVRLTEGHVPTFAWSSR